MGILHGAQRLYNTLHQYDPSTPPATCARPPLPPTDQVYRASFAVGSILGFALVFGGSDAVNWALEDKKSFPPYKGFVPIVCSWFISPIFTGVCAALLFTIIRLVVLKRKNSYQLSFFLLPFFVALTVWLCIYFTLTKVSRVTGVQCGSLHVHIPHPHQHASSCLLPIGTWYIKYSQLLTLLLSGGYLFRLKRHTVIRKTAADLPFHFFAIHVLALLSALRCLCATSAALMMSCVAHREPRSTLKRQEGP
jgi:phosphate/sulfate permease